MRSSPIPIQQTPDKIRGSCSRVNPLPENFFNSLHIRFAEISRAVRADRAALPATRLDRPGRAASSRCEQPLVSFGARVDRMLVASGVAGCQTHPCDYRRKTRSNRLPAPRSPTIRKRHNIQSAAAGFRASRAASVGCQSPGASSCRYLCRHGDSTPRERK
jgi:hypothetical protein